ncbi:hypothetical protein TNCV_947041 [Trichonephila clavipes]|nr:hypothetical protein TNCV_947041 [Trichonephila clavipes]
MICKRIKSKLVHKFQTVDKIKRMFGGVLGVYEKGGLPVCAPYILMYNIFRIFADPDVLEDGHVFEELETFCEKRYALSITSLVNRCFEFLNAVLVLWKFYLPPQIWPISENLPQKAKNKCPRCGRAYENGKSLILMILIRTMELNYCIVIDPGQIRFVDESMSVISIETQSVHVDVVRKNEVPDQVPCRPRPLTEVLN